LKYTNFTSDDIINQRFPKFFEFFDTGLAGQIAS